MDFREEMQTSPLFSFLGRIPCINTKGVRIDYLTYFSSKGVNNEVMDSITIQVTLHI
jgi:hypothetical protein